MIPKDMEPGYSTEYIKINNIDIAFMRSHFDLNEDLHIMIPHVVGAHLIRFSNNEFNLNTNIIRGYNFDFGPKHQLKIIGIDLV